MGYNFFHPRDVSQAANIKLNQFRDSLGGAICRGRGITFADRDITYALKLQHDRIAEKGLELDYNIYQRKRKDNKFIAGSNWRDAHYESTVCFNFCGIKREVKKDGIRIFRDDRKSVLYETVTDVISGVHPENDPICCPNCGAVSTVAGIQNGCSYCGTRFQMDELFPKVSSYHFMDDAGITRKEFGKGYLISYAIALAISLIIILIFNRTDIVSYIIAPFASIFMGYIVLAYYLLIRFIVLTISSMEKMGTAGSRRSFETRMKRVSPEFSYEYFTSKAISLIKTTIFSRNEHELTFYKGGPLDPKMKDIIDLNYGGALGCESFVDEGNYVTVVTKAYFDVLYATDEKIYEKSEVYTAKFVRRTDIPVNFNFSITKIGCPCCGASFDATTHRNCPYCGNAYDVITDDWVLIELKKL